MPDEQELRRMIKELNPPWRMSVEEKSEVALTVLEDLITSMLRDKESEAERKYG